MDNSDHEFDRQDYVPNKYSEFDWNAYGPKNSSFVLIPRSNISTLSAESSQAAPKQIPLFKKGTKPFGFDPSLVMKASDSSISRNYLTNDREQRTSTQANLKFQDYIDDMMGYVRRPLPPLPEPTIAANSQSHIQNPVLESEINSYARLRPKSQHTVTFADDTVPPWKRHRTVTPFEKLTTISKMNRHIKSDMAKMEQLRVAHLQRLREAHEMGSRGSKSKAPTRRRYFEDIDSYQRGNREDWNQTFKRNIGDNTLPRSNIRNHIREHNNDNEDAEVFYSFNEGDTHPWAFETYLADGSTLHRENHTQNKNMNDPRPLNKFKEKVWLKGTPSYPKLRRKTIEHKADQEAEGFIPLLPPNHYSETEGKMYTTNADKVYIGASLSNLPQFLPVPVSTLDEIEELSIKSTRLPPRPLSSYQAHMDTNKSLESHRTNGNTNRNHEMHFAEIDVNQNMYGIIDQKSSITIPKNPFPSPRSGSCDSLPLFSCDLTANSCIQSVSKLPEQAKVTDIPSGLPSASNGKIDLEALPSHKNSEQELQTLPSKTASSSASWTILPTPSDSILLEVQAATIDWMKRINQLLDINPEFVPKFNHQSSNLADKDQVQMQEQNKEESKETQPYIPRPFTTIIKRGTSIQNGNDDIIEPTVTKVRIAKSRGRRTVTSRSTKACKLRKRKKKPEWNTSVSVERNKKLAKANARMNLAGDVSLIKSHNERCSNSYSRPANVAKHKSFKIKEEPALAKKSMLKIAIGKVKTKRNPLKNSKIWEQLITNEDVHLQTLDDSCNNAKTQGTQKLGSSEQKNIIHPGQESGIAGESIKFKEATRSFKDFDSVNCIFPETKSSTPFISNAKDLIDSTAFEELAIQGFGEAKLDPNSINFAAINLRNCSKSLALDLDYLKAKPTTSKPSFGEDCTELALKQYVSPYKKMLSNMQAKVPKIERSELIRKPGESFGIIDWQKDFWNQVPISFSPRHISIAPETCPMNEKSPIEMLKQKERESSNKDYIEKHLEILDKGSCCEMTSSLYNWRIFDKNNDLNNFQFQPNNFDESTKATDGLKSLRLETLDNFDENLNPITSEQSGILLNPTESRSFDDLYFCNLKQDLNETRRVHIMDQKYYCELDNNKAFKANKSTLNLPKAPPPTCASEDCSVASVEARHSEESWLGYSENCRCHECRKRKKLCLYRNKSMTQIRPNYIRQNILATKRAKQNISGKDPTTEVPRKIVDNVRGDKVEQLPCFRKKPGFGKVPAYLSHIKHDICKNAIFATEAKYFDSKSLSFNKKKQNSNHSHKWNATVPFGSMVSKLLDTNVTSQKSNLKDLECLLKVLKSSGSSGSFDTRRKKSYSKTWNHDKTVSKPTSNFVSFNVKTKKSKKHSGQLESSKFETLGLKPVKKRAQHSLLHNMYVSNYFDCSEDTRIRGVGEIKDSNQKEIAEMDPKTDAEHQYVSLAHKNFWPSDKVNDGATCSISSGTKTAEVIARSGTMDESLNWNSEISSQAGMQSEYRSTLKDNANKSALKQRAMPTSLHLDSVRESSRRKNGNIESDKSICSSQESGHGEKSGESYITNGDNSVEKKSNSANELVCREHIRRNNNETNLTCHTSLSNKERVKRTKSSGCY